MHRTTQPFIVPIRIERQLQCQVIKKEAKTRRSKSQQADIIISRRIDLAAPYPVKQNPARNDYMIQAKTKKKIKISSISQVRYPQ